MRQRALVIGSPNFVYFIYDGDDSDGVGAGPGPEGSCDTFDNVSLEALDINSDAVAASVLTYGMSTEDINDEKGKGNFKVPNRDFAEKS